VVVNISGLAASLAVLVWRLLENGHLKLGGKS